MNTLQSVYQIQQASAPENTQFLSVGLVIICLLLLILLWLPDILKKE